MTSGLAPRMSLICCDNVVEISADPVELVHKDNTSDFGVVGVAPVGLGLGFNTTGSTKDADAAVEHFQGTINLNRKVNVSRGIDDVHAMAIPEASGGSGLNGNAALCLLLHEVGGGFSVMDLTRFVNFTGELENSLGVVVLPASTCAKIPILLYLLRSFMPVVSGGCWAEGVPAGRVSSRGNGFCNSKDDGPFRNTSNSYRTAPSF